MEEDRIMSFYKNVIVSLVLGMVAYLAAGALLPALPPTQLMEGEDVWAPLIHLQWNSYYSWRSVSHLFGSLLYLPLFAATLSLWLSSERSRSMSTIVTVVLTLLLLPLFSRDITVWGTIALAPAVLLFLAHERNLPFVVSLALGLLLGSQVALAANQLSPLVIITALAIAWPRGREEVRERWCVVALLLLPPLLTMLLGPVPQTPLYPVRGTVVPDDGVAGVLRALLGADAPLPYLDRARVAALLPLGLLVVTLTTFSWLISRDRTSRAALVLASVALLDVALPPSLAIIAPLQTLQRILPGVLQIPLTPPVLALALVLTSPTLATVGGGFLLLATVGALLFSPIRFSVEVSREITRLLKEYEMMREEDPLQAEELRRVLVSPSLQLLARHGGGVLHLREVTEAFHSGARLQLKTSSNTSNDGGVYRPLFDRNDKTRWTAGGAVQRPGMRLCVELKEERRIRGVEPSPGVYHSDFPRGLSLELGRTCESTKIVAHYSPWLGSLKFTSDGYPYYGPQGEVKILLPEAISARCVCVVQTEEFQGHDWSVAELNLMTE